MSTLPNYSINYCAPLAASAAVNIGQVMIPNGTDGTYYVVATAANRGTRRAEGVAISAWGGATGNVGTFRLLQSGVLPAESAGLGPGAKSWVRCSDTGELERFTPALGGDSDVVGTCEEDGRVHLLCGLFTETSIYGGGPRNALNWFNVLDYGAVADGVTDNTAAFTAAIQASGAANPHASGLPDAPSTQPYGGVVYVPPADGVYYFADDLYLTRMVELRGPGGTTSINHPAVLNFAAGKGIIVTAFGTSPETDGTAQYGVIRNLRIKCAPLTLPVRANLTTYAPGDLVRLKNDNRFYYRCKVGGTSAASSPFGGDTMAGQGAFDSEVGRSFHYDALVTTVDGSVTWECLVACGIRADSICDIVECSVEGATNAGIGIYADAGQVPATNANGLHIERCYVFNCGVGIQIGYGDGNCVKVANCRLVDIGLSYNESHGAGAGQGGFGIVNASFLGALIVGNDLSGGGTGCGIWETPAGTAFSVYIGNHVEEWGFDSWYRSVMIGEVPNADPHSPHTGYDASDKLWKNIVVGHPDLFTKRPVIHVENQAIGFNLRLNDEDPGYVFIADRYYTASGPGLDGVGIGSWVTGSQYNSFLGQERRIYGITGTGVFALGPGRAGGPTEGPCNFRLYRGYFAGNGLAPFYHGLDGASSKTDILVRRDSPGVGGHRLEGDLFDHIADSIGADTVGQVCYSEGWAAPAAWSSGTVAIYSDNLGWVPSGTVHPTSPNGFTYACSKSGTTSVSEPTWPTSFLTDGTYPNGGILPTNWTTNHVRRVGDYGVPSTRNGHWYKVTAATSTDVDGYTTGAATEPSWNTGGGSTTTDGHLTWTEQGSDAGTYVVDGSTQWQCIGPAPKYRNFGTRTFVPYKASGPTEVTVGYYDTDGTTLRKLVSVNAGADPVIGDASGSGLKIVGGSVSTSGDFTTSQIDFTELPLGAASFDSSGNLQSSLGSANQLLSTNGSATGLVWVDGGGGTTYDGENLGTGEGVFSNVSGGMFEFKSLVAGSNVTITSDATQIYISASGGSGPSGDAIIDVANANYTVSGGDLGKRILIFETTTTMSNNIEIVFPNPSAGAGYDLLVGIDASLISMSYTLKLWLGSGVGVSTFEPIAAGVYHIYVLGESGPTWSGVGVTKT